MVANKIDLVVKSNRLVEASYRLSLTEQQLVLYSIIKGRDEQRGFRVDEPMSIEAKAFGEKFGIDQSHVYTMLKDAVSNLYRRQVVIHDVHPKTGKPRVVHTRWVSDVAYVDGAGIVELTFAPKMVAFVTRLETEFTEYRLERIGRMTSAHAVRVYELLVQYLAAGERKIGLLEFKDMLGIANEYPRIFDLKKHVLEPAVNQINEHSDLLVSYDQGKTGRTVTHLIFKIKAKPAAKPDRARKRVEITKEYIDKHALPGESYDTARSRLLKQTNAL